MQVRRLRADEVEGWKQVRLAGLLDSPENFGATYIPLPRDPAVMEVEMRRELDAG